jgi:hypothetical protein
MQPGSLYYKRKDRWVPLTQWGQFFLKLGYVLGTQEASENRIIAGLALPIRAYAASLTATGIIAGRLSCPAHSDEALKRFQQLLTLAEGTSLYYRREKGERVTVTFDGSTTDGSMIKLRSGRCTYIIPPGRALRVEFPFKELPSISRCSHRKSNINISPFLSNFFNGITVEEIVLQSRLDCVIIGSIGHIEQEINYSQFAVQSSQGEYLEGTLQDIVRVRRFSTDAETYRSDVFYTHNQEYPGSQQEIPEIVIFDGAKSYLKWGTSYSYPHCIVLLTQTEPEFDAAVQIFNENFAKNRLDEVTFESLLNIPKGVPFSIYQETRK